MRFIDSNVLAYAFYNNEHMERCQQIIREKGVINTLNLIEAYNIIQFETNQEQATRAIKSLLTSTLTIVNTDVNLVFEALKRTKKYKNLKFIDFVHYTTALLHACNKIASYDADFDGLDIARIAE